MNPATNSGDVTPEEFFGSVRGIGVKTYPILEVSNNRVVPEDPRLERMKRKLATMEKSIEKLSEPRPLKPIADLKFKVDILARFPEWKELTTPQIMARLKVAKRNDRKAKLAAFKKELAKKQERILTAEARARKIELMVSCKGSQKGFLKLHGIAGKQEGVDIDGFTKTELITIILEKEFANPYEEFIAPQSSQ